MPPSPTAVSPGSRFSRAQDRLEPHSLATRGQRGEAAPAAEDTQEADDSQVLRCREPSGNPFGKKVYLRGVRRKCHFLNFLISIHRHHSKIRTFSLFPQGRYQFRSPRSVLLRRARGPLFHGQCRAESGQEPREAPRSSETGGVFGDGVVSKEMPQVSELIPVKFSKNEGEKEEPLGGGNAEPRIELSEALPGAGRSINPSALSHQGIAEPAPGDFIS